MRLNDLYEAVPLSLYRPLHGTGQPHFYDALFDRFSHYMKKGRNRLYFPLRVAEKPIDSEFEIARQTIQEIDNWAANAGDIVSIEDMYDFQVQIRPVLQRRLQMTFDDAADQERYVRGIVSIEGRDFRIGKLLGKCETEARKLAQVQSVDYPTLGSEILARLLKAKARYETDPVRSLKANPADRYTVVISRHPYDIAGMSTGRGWTSCTNLVDGGDAHYVLSYVKNASLVAYLIRSTDLNIEHPVSRLIIDRYDSTDGSGDFVLYPASDTYGAGGAAFVRMVDKFCAVVNRGRADGLYCNDKSQQYPGRVRKDGNTTKHRSGYID